jgi:dolichol-phosphate mannosyltransferase
MNCFRNQSPMGKYLRFCAVGGIGLGVDMAVLRTLTLMGLSVIISKIIAAEIAMVNNFFWNDRWTFSDCSERRNRFPEATKFLRFNVISSIGILLSATLLKFQIDTFKINLFIANFIAIVLVSFWNFGLNLVFCTWSLNTSEKKNCDAFDCKTKL